MDDVKKYEAMSEVEALQVLVDRHIANGIVKCHRGIALSEIESMSIRFASASGVKPSIRAMKFAQAQGESAVPSNQLVTTKQRIRRAPASSLFQPADERRRIWMT